MSRQIIPPCRREQEVADVPVVVEFFRLDPEEGWEPDEPVRLGPFSGVSLDGPRLVAAAGEVLAVLGEDDCWLRPGDTRRWSDFRIVPEGGLLEVVFHPVKERCGGFACRFEWLQATYSFLRRPPAGDDLAFFGPDGTWRCPGSEPAGSVVIRAARVEGAGGGEAAVTASARSIPPFQREPDHVSWTVDPVDLLAAMEDYLRQQAGIAASDFLSLRRDEDYPEVYELHVLRDVLSPEELSRLGALGLALDEPAALFDRLLEALWGIEGATGFAVGQLIVVEAPYRAFHARPDEEVDHDV
ncbi:MAG: hypothetical protein ACPLRW_05585 [Moorellales bacterium]